MHLRLRRRTRLCLGSLALAGVVLTHVLAYYLVAPDAADRRVLLALTGHAHWTLFVGISLGALAAGFAGFLVQAVYDIAAPVCSCRSYATVALRLGMFQTVGFLALETAERALAPGHSMAGVAAEPVVVVGLGVQGVVALIGALFVRLFERAVEQVSDCVHGRLVAPPLPCSRVALSPPGILLPSSKAAVGAYTLRGPPVMV